MLRILAMDTSLVTDADLETILAAVAIIPSVTRSENHTTSPNGNVGALDALASLLLSEPKEEVFAIGVQRKASEIVLTVAGNSGNYVPESTRNHLKNVWNLLKEISEFEIASESNSPSADGSQDSSSRKQQKARESINRRTPIGKIVEQLAMLCLGFSAAKIRSRLHKHLTTIVKLVLLIEQDSTNEGHRQQSLVQLKVIMIDIRDHLLGLNHWLGQDPMNEAHRRLALSELRGIQRLLETVKAEEYGVRLLVFTKKTSENLHLDCTF